MWTNKHTTPGSKLHVAFSTQNAAPGVLAPGSGAGDRVLGSDTAPTATIPTRGQGQAGTEQRSAGAPSWAQQREQLHVHHSESPQTPVRARAPRCCWSPGPAQDTGEATAAAGMSQRWYPRHHHGKKEQGAERCLGVFFSLLFFFWH